MMFGGTEEPCAYGELISIGGRFCRCCRGRAGPRHDAAELRGLRRLVQSKSKLHHNAGAIGGDKNKKISAALAEVVTRHLGVPASRLYIKVQRDVLYGRGAERGRVWAAVGWWPSPCSCRRGRPAAECGPRPPLAATAAVGCTPAPALLTQVLPTTPPPHRSSTTSRGQTLAGMAVSGGGLLGRRARSTGEQAGLLAGLVAVV